jgi:acetylornithine deacetylase
MNYHIDENFLKKTLSDLIKINSINPKLSPGGGGEAEIGSYIADLLTSIGLDVAVHQIEPGRVNVIGKLKGTGSGRSLVLNAHLDTVGVDGMVIDPFQPVIKGDRMYGRGAQDMKGSLAAMISGVKALADHRIELGGDLYFTAVADEEFASIGTEDLVKRLSADAAIVTEPTDLSIGRAHRGFIWFDVETFGRAAHGSRYQEGIDANMRMGRFLAELDHLEKALRHRTPHPLVGPPSLHASRINGGTELSIYAAHCLLQLERRTIPGETVKMATSELEAIIDLLSDQDETFKAKVAPTFYRKPFEISPHAAVVQCVEKAVVDRVGEPPTHTGQTFWTDAALLAEAGMETVLIGPRGGGLHSEEEWVELPSVLDLAYILADAAIDYCQSQ